MNANLPPNNNRESDGFERPDQPSHDPYGIFKIVGLNLGYFATYQVIIGLIARDIFVIADMFALLMYGVAMVILMFVHFHNGRKTQAIGQLCSLIIILLIGYGTCSWVGFAIAMDD